MFIADSGTSYERWDAEQADWLRKRPTCDRCHEKIQDEYAYEIEPGELWCENCANEWVKEQRKDVEDLLKEEW